MPVTLLSDAKTGPPRFEDRNDVVGLDRIDAQNLWPIEFWMGGFDGHLMIDSMRGTLSLPFRS